MIDPSSRRMEPSEREHLINGNVEAIETNYVESVRRGCDDPVVFVWDTRFEDARDFATRLGADVETMERNRREATADGVIPTVINSLPRWQAYKFLREAQRDLHRFDKSNPKESPAVEALKNPPPAGTFYVIAWGGGKNDVSGGKIILAFKIPD